MASIATIATEIRPRFVGVLLLTVAVVPWRDHQHGERMGAEPPRVARALPPTLPLTIDVPMASVADDVVAPPPMADAADWPHGMVIRPPAIDGAILQWKDSPLDNILSVLLVPFRAIGA